MYFDRMVRRHDVRKTLSLARRMFAQYLNDDWRKELSKTDSNEEKSGGGEMAKSASTSRLKTQQKHQEVAAGGPKAC